MLRWYRSLASLVFAFSLLGALPPLAARAEGCGFVLGFATLHASIPAIAGDCIDNESHRMDGNGIQNTINGYFFWRKADNHTAFTNGRQTWINGPAGLQSRPANERFTWEVNQAKVASTRVISFVPPESAKVRAVGECTAMSIAATRPDAFHCTTSDQQESFATCFAMPASPSAVMCVADPTDPASFIQLDLTQPLPLPPATPAPAQPWFLQLADGSTCSFFINAHNDSSGNVGSQLINYHCSSGWDLLDLPQRGPIWTIPAVLRAADYTVRESATAQIAIAWE